MSSMRSRGSRACRAKSSAPVDVRERHLFVDVSAEHANSIIAKVESRGDQGPSRSKLKWRERRSPNQIGRAPVPVRVEGAGLDRWAGHAGAQQKAGCTSSLITTDISENSRAQILSEYALPGSAVLHEADLEKFSH